MEEKRMDENKILVVEDDGDIHRLLVRILKKGGYETLSAYSGTEARLLLEREEPMLILFDLMLPGISGEEVIHFVRQELKNDIPILILSAKSSLESKIETITRGADDYITKPFEPEEVLVRIMAVLRRYKPESGKKPEQHMTYRQLSLNPVSRIVTAAGKQIALTPHEFEILRILLGQPDKVFSREALYEQVWKNGYYGEDNTVNVHISNIRRKLSAAGIQEEYIKTVWGIGFKMA